MTTSVAEPIPPKTTSRVKNPASVVVHEPAHEYHTKAGQYLSSHLLGDFRRCPLMYRRRVDREIIEDQGRPAYIMGRAVHTLVLEGKDRFLQEFALCGPINPATGKPYGRNTHAWEVWAKTNGKDVLTDEQFQCVTKMQRAVYAHAFAAELLREGVPEGVVRAKYCGLPCQIRMDWFDPHRGIVDLKTCDDLTYFEADARRYGYVHQMAFYRAVLAERIGLQMPVHFIAIEKKEPHRCGVWKVDPQALSIAQGENEAAIGRLKRCQETSVWPTGYEEVRVFDAA
jgi:hypothetical protein